VNVGAQTVDQPVAALESALSWFQRQHQKAVSESPFFTLSWTRREHRAQAWGPRVLVHLRRLPGNRTLVVGIEREHR
jgi:hypothetical protein